MAVRLRQRPEGCMFHSDRGSQYCSYDYQKKLHAHGLRPPMSGKGNCYANASVETFFKSPEAELIWRHKWPTRR
jgi:putative transposase